MKNKMSIEGWREFDRLVIAEQLLAILNKADEDYNGRPQEADEEHNFQYAHSN